MFYHCLFKLQFLTLLLNEHINDGDIILYYIILCYVMLLYANAHTVAMHASYVYVRLHTES